MSALEDIRERRARLVAEAESQRKALAGHLAACGSVLTVVDRGITWARWLRARPYAVVALVAAIAVLKPKFALLWSARIVTLWRAGRFVYEAVKRFSGDSAATRRQTSP